MLLTDQLLLCPYHDITGGMKYLIKGCAGQGGFAQVYKANVNSDPDNVVALKVMMTFQIIFLLIENHCLI